MVFNLLLQKKTFYQFFSSSFQIEVIKHLRKPPVDKTKTNFIFCYVIHQSKCFLLVNTQIPRYLLFISTILKNFAISVSKNSTYVSSKS